MSCLPYSPTNLRKDNIAGKALRDAATKGMDGILSQEPTVARHALALALYLAQHNAPQLLDAQKDLATVVAATCSTYEASGERCLGIGNLLSIANALMQPLGGELIDMGPGQTPTQGHFNGYSAAST